MIVHQIDVEGAAILEPENDSPVCAHRNRPETLQVALERVQPERRNIEGGDTLRRVQHRQNLSDLANVLGVKPARIVVLEKLS
jgi:hypothetical protein